MEKIDETIYTENYLGKIGELALKGGNIKLFERQLVNNLKEALRGQKAIVQIMTGRLYVYSARECTAQVEYALDHLIGITGWAKARAVEKDIESIRCNVCLDGEECSEYMTDFVCTKVNGDLMVRECISQKLLAKPQTAVLLDLSQSYWQRRGVTDWGLVVDAAEE